jgi:hypothetical protein
MLDIETLYFMLLDTVESTDTCENRYTDYEIPIQFPSLANSLFAHIILSQGEGPTRSS